MDFIKVDSSMIEEVSYVVMEGRLYVRFKNGSLFAYHDVPKFIYDELMEAESTGKFFHEYIKKVFTFTKLPDIPE